MSNAEIVAKDSVVGFHYRMCRIDGAGAKSDWLESSFDGDAVFYLHGHHNLIAGMEKAMLNHKAGDEFEVTIAPEQGYGMRRENSVQRIPMKHLILEKKHKKLLPGAVISVQTDKGARNMVVVKAGKFNVDVDTNHPLAGLTLHYEIKIDSVRAASPEELSHGHVHGPGGHHH